MDGVGSVSAMKGAQVQSEVSTRLLKKTQDMAQSQMSQLIQSMPQAPSMGSIGGGLDVTG